MIRAKFAGSAEWMLEHLGPDVPLHFTAFHPDFKLQDKPRLRPRRCTPRDGLRSKRGCITCTKAISTAKRRTRIVQVAAEFLFDAPGTMSWRTRFEKVSVPPAIMPSLAGGRTLLGFRAPRLPRKAIESQANTEP